MGADQYTDWQGAAAELLQWWQLAGVDAVVEEHRQDWRARAAPVLPATDPVSVSLAVLPGTLAELEAWRIGEHAPERSWGHAKVAAEGDPAADLMVIVDQPDPDSEGLLGGRAGKLFDAMLKAIGRDRGSIYLTAVCLCRTSGGRILPEASDRLYEIARHHVWLATPKGVLALGSGATRALLGGEVPGMRGSLRGINHGEGKRVGPPVVASFHPRQLLERPMWKADAWKDLRLLMGALDA